MSRARWAPAWGSWWFCLRERGRLRGSGNGDRNVAIENLSPPVAHTAEKAPPRGEPFLFPAATPTHAGCLLTCNVGSLPLWHVVWRGGSSRRGRSSGRGTARFRKSVTLHNAAARSAGQQGDRVATFPHIPRAPQTRQTHPTGHPLPTDSAEEPRK